MAGHESQAAQLFAVLQLRGRIGKRCRSLGDAFFELLIQLFKLARLAVKLDEHLYFCPQHLRDHRHGDIVDGAHLITAQPVDIVEQEWPI